MARCSNKRERVTDDNEFRDDSQSHQVLDSNLLCCSTCAAGLGGDRGRRFLTDTTPSRHCNSVLCCCSLPCSKAAPNRRRCPPREPRCVAGNGAGDRSVKTVRSRYLRKQSSSCLPSPITLRAFRSTRLLLGDKDAVLVSRESDCRTTMHTKGSEASIPGFHQGLVDGDSPAAKEESTVQPSAQLAESSSEAADMETMHSNMNQGQTTIPPSGMIKSRLYCYGSCECSGATPVFGPIGSSFKSEARWCNRCPGKLAGAVYLGGHQCQCGNRQPSFGLPGEPCAAARWCAKCPSKPSDAVDVVSKKCLCGNSIPSFGLPGETRAAARWCSKCPDKPPNAVDIKSKRCNCGVRQPSFGLPGQAPGTARWCAKCPDKPPNSINVVSRRCLCGKRQPVFALPGDLPKDARWCSMCPDKPPNAVDIKHKKCLCGRSSPCFKLPQEASSAVWCSKCPDKPSNAVDTKSKRCLCGKSRPSFGLLGEAPGAARWCSKCPDRHPDAVNTKKKKTMP